jgi:hypothetical protein
VLNVISTNATYEESLQALEDRFRDQHFAAAYGNQLTTRTQEAGESIQNFATAVEQVAHRTHPAQPENHIKYVNMSLRAIGLLLDFIHRLVCGRQKIPKRFGDWIWIWMGQDKPTQLGPLENAPST